jgi:phosphoglycolate phosphatase-like HAD superfamily hydrolase
MAPGLTETATGFDQGVRVDLDLTHLDGSTIAFDLDGTLVESAPDLVATLNVLLTQEGIEPLPLSQARDMIGQGARSLIAKGFEASGADIAEPRLSILFDRFIAHYREHIADGSHVFPGVTDALDLLSGAGARLVVCTNKQTDLSVALLEALGIAHRFAAIVGPTPPWPPSRTRGTCWSPSRPAADRRSAPSWSATPSRTPAPRGRPACR